MIEAPLGAEAGRPGHQTRAEAPEGLSDGVRCSVSSAPDAA
jgi:hypothetical protein